VLCKDEVKPPNRLACIELLRKEEDKTSFGIDCIEVLCKDEVNKLPAQSAAQKRVAKFETSFSSVGLKVVRLHPDWIG
jgi:hypothetical protein